MRTIIIKQDTDLQALRGRLIAGKTTAGQAEMALKQLQELNPHLDLNKIHAGAVILVPDAPNFKATEGDPVGSGTFAEFQQLVRSSLADAADRLKSGNAARASERTDITAALKTAAFKRILETDADLKQQLADATKSFKDEQQQADKDEQAVAAAAKQALSILSQLGQNLG
jgi:hypothetical protein